MNEENLERKITSLRETLSWMDLVMANINEGILVVDDKCRIIFANSYLAEMLGQNRVLLLGNNVFDVLPFLKSKKHTKGKTLEITSIDKLDGVYDFPTHRIVLKIMFNSKYVSNLNQAVCIISDVSVELKAEDKLMELNREIASLKQENK